MRRFGVLAVSAAVISIAGVSASAAASEPQLTATVSHTRLHSRGNHSFALRVRIANDGPAQRVVFDVAGARWPGGQTGGGPLRFGQPSMDGPGTVTPAAFSVPPIFPYACFRGPAYDFDILVVNVPAQTTTTVVVPLRAVVPPWPGTRYTPTVNATYADGTQVGVGVPRVKMPGPTGFRIALRVRHPRTLIRARTPATIAGRTFPTVPNALVRVTVRRIGTHSLGSLFTTLVETTRTNSSGRFRAGWRPRSRGIYLVAARIPDPGPGLLRDATCPTSVSVLARR